ncbi:MAG: hypothetical protein O7H41_01730 [Planctomycetota bacterium]|nr:hypothetical protein [Planctomycetota bacterium]
MEEKSWQRFNNFRVQIVPSSCEVTCDPRTQGFWKRQCENSHPSGEHGKQSSYVPFINGTATFANVIDVAGICDALHPTPRNDKCAQAQAQFMALLLNVASERLIRGCCIDTGMSGAMTVGEAVTEIDALLSDPGRTREECVTAQSLADSINTGAALCFGRTGGGSPLTTERDGIGETRGSRPRPGDAVVVPRR